MYLYLLTQEENKGYDTYDSCVVCAENEEAAKLITPDGKSFSDSSWFPWASSPKNVKAEFLGVAKEGLVVNTVICSSFNAG